MKDSTKKTLDNIMYRILQVMLVTCTIILLTGLVVKKCEFLNIVVYSDVTIGYIGALVFLLAWDVMALMIMFGTFAASNMSLRTVLWNTDAPGFTFFFITSFPMFALANYAIYLVLTSPVSEVMMYISR